jgi:hypothetical protein
MGSFKDFYSSSLDNNLNELQMMERVKKLKSKEKIQFDLKNLKKEKVDKFKQKLTEMNIFVIIESGKIIIQKP